jgi:hypothetical protein
MTRAKAIPQGLKPIFMSLLMSELKLRPLWSQISGVRS